MFSIQSFHFVGLLASRNIKWDEIFGPASKTTLSFVADQQNISSVVSAAQLMNHAKLIKLAPVLKAEIAPYLCKLPITATKVVTI